MIQLQIVIEVNPETNAVRLQANALDREDASEAERELAKAIEELHASIFEMLVDQHGGTMRRIGGAQ